MFSTEAVLSHLEISYGSSGNYKYSVHNGYYEWTVNTMMLLGVCGLPCLLRCQADHYPRQVRDRRDRLPVLCPRLGSGEQGLEES